MNLKFPVDIQLVTLLLLLLLLLLSSLNISELSNDKIIKIFWESVSPEKYILSNNTSFLSIDICEGFLRDQSVSF